MRPTRSAFILATSAVLALSGCAASPDRDQGVAYTDAGYSAPAVGYDTYPEAAMESSAAPMEPSVITTGYLTMIVENPSESADEIAGIVTAAGGRVQSRSDYTPVDFAAPSSYLDVRIPSEDFESTLEDITQVGQVQDVSINTVDVSLQKIDLDARIEVLEAAIQRLNDLLQTAETTADLIAVQTALTERQAELDSLRSQRDYLTDQTVFATVSISLQTPVDAAPTDPGGFLDGILRGWEGILAFAAGAIVWAGILVPWLGLLLAAVAIILVIRAVLRRIRRRRG